MQSSTSTNTAARLHRGSTAQPTLTTADFGDGLRLTALLHDGPWSRVWRARTDGSPADEPGQYAVKVPATATHDRLTAENMLRREAAVLKSVQHANVASLLDAQLHEGPCYLLMPFLEGATLADVFRAGLRVPIGHALWIVRQIAQAQAAVHAAGWIHADIKPDNVHVSPSGHATLLDFGLARREPAMGGTERQAALAGTLQFMAPEHFRSGAPIDARSDIYSLGVIFYQLLSGQPPFSAPNAASLVDAHLHQTPPRLRLPRSPVAVDIHELLARMLAKDPLRRPQTATDLAQRLMRLEIAMLHDQVQAA